jgi:hypothetical protein
MFSTSGHQFKADFLGDDQCQSCRLLIDLEGRFAQVVYSLLTWQKDECRP